MQASLQTMGRERNLRRVTNERDDELALFLEMRRREKENNLLLLPSNNNNISNNNCDELDASLLESNNNGNSPISKSISSMPLHRKTRTDEFLNSESEKSDYDWLLTPPATPLFPSLEMEVQKTLTTHIDGPAARPTALRSRLANIQVEPTTKSNTTSKHPTLPSALNSSSNSNRRSSPSGGTTAAPCRSATPTGRPTFASTTTKSSRSSTPNSQATLLSSKPVAPPVRSSTPTRSSARSSTPTRSSARSSNPTRSSARSSTPTRSSARSSTPTSRPSVPASKSTARSATPTRQPSNPSSVTVASAPTARSASASKSRPASSKNPMSSRGSSPTLKSRPWKPSEMPGFSLDAPPNLRTSLPERPSSTSRGRPGVPSVKSSSVAAAGSNGRPRQQSCSPSRGRVSHVNNTTTNGISISSMSKSRSIDSDKVSPVLFGSKMVERVVNMRKLAPPKQDDRHSSHTNSAAGKSLSSDSSGFGRTLSKKSLDMAMRHMDIRRSMQGNLQPLVTSIPASSMYSIKLGPTKSKTTSISDSPLATSSNASSEPSVNNFSVCIDGSDIEDIDFGSQHAS